MISNPLRIAVKVAAWRARWRGLAFGFCAIALTCAVSNGAWVAQTSNDPMLVKLQNLSVLKDAEILARYEIQPNVYSNREPLYRDIEGLVNLWQARGDAQARTQAKRLLNLALAEWSNQSPAELAQKITLNGSRDPINLGLRDACLLFAQRAALTNDPANAKSAISLLNRFAVLIPKWPIWCPISVDEQERKALDPRDPKTYQDEAAAGVWGKWIYFDLLESLPLLKARNLIREQSQEGLDSDNLQQLFDHLVRVQDWHGVEPDYSNMDAFQIRGKLWFGALLPDPDLFRRGLTQLRNLYKVGFYPDGWWWESSLSYHKDLQTVLRQVVAEFGTHIAELSPAGSKAADRSEGTSDLRRELVSRVERADRVIRDSRLPNGNFLAVHDSIWDDRSDPVSERASFPALFGAMGQGSVAAGFEGGSTVATLHWGRSSTHAHHDSLNLHVWSKGREIFSETTYRPLAASGSSREWHSSTPAHVTVTVDEVDQAPIGSRGRNIRAARSEDAIKGIDWRWRWNSWQAASDFGTLRLFNTDFPKVQVIEADAPAAYSAVAPVTRYRRTIALVEIDERDNYILDIFRVSGGSTHDYVMHGCLQDAYSLEVSPKLTPREGTLFRYLSNLHTGRTSNAWLAAWRMGGDITTYSIFAKSPETEVTVADAPAMRREGQARFLVVRRRGGENVFVVLHHVTLAGDSRIKGFELLETSASGAVACKITLKGRVDTVVSSDDRGRSVKVSDSLEMTGAFGHVAESAEGSALWMYLIDGTALSRRAFSIVGDVSHEGRIVEVERREAGQDRNAFIPQQPIQSGDGLSGYTLLVEPTELPTWGYRVQSVEQLAGRSIIMTNDEPGLTIRGDSVKQEYFPNWGSYGPVHYRIPGSALWMRNADGSSYFRQSGVAELRGGH